MRGTITLTAGQSYPANGTTRVVNVAGWRRYGQVISDDVRDDGYYELVNYDAGAYFEGPNHRYLGPDEFGVEPVFEVETR